MSASPETPYAEYWPDAYRFALLMTGSAAGAQAAIQGAIPDAAERLTQIRDDRQARRWLFTRLRERCRTLTAPEAPANGVNDADPVRCFSRLPEPERAALALFYLQRFEADELAEALDLSPLALGQLLDGARQLLGRHWKPAAELISADPAMETP